MSQADLDKARQEGYKLYCEHKEGHITKGQLIQEFYAILRPVEFGVVHQSKYHSATLHDRQTEIMACIRQWDLEREIANRKSAEDFARNASAPDKGESPIVVTDDPARAVNALAVSAPPSKPFGYLVGAAYKRIIELPAGYLTAIVQPDLDPQTWETYRTLDNLDPAATDEDQVDMIFHGLKYALYHLIYGSAFEAASYHFIQSGRSITICGKSEAYLIHVMREKTVYSPCRQCQALIEHKPYYEGE